MFEKEHAVVDPVVNPLLQKPRQEPQPDAFQKALRSNWKRHNRARPVVRRNQRSQPVFHIRSTNDHVRVAKRAATRLDEYSRQLKPTLDAVCRVRDRPAHAHLAGSKSILAPATSNAPTPPTGASSVRYDASRDPRLRGFKI